MRFIVVVFGFRIVVLNFYFIIFFELEMFIFVCIIGGIFVRGCGG